MWNKVKRMKCKILSKAGKVVLLRNVAQAIPTYAISCFILPKSLSKELDIIMNSFWRGSSEGGSKGIKWLSSSNICMSKGSGGLGLRDMFGFNLVFLGKNCWNFLSNPNPLVARVLKARNFAITSLFEASHGRGYSYIWSGLWHTKEFLKKGFR